MGIRDFQLDDCQIVVGKTTFRSKIRITVDTVESIVLIEPLRQISIDWVKDLREVPLPVSRPIRVSEGHIPEAARCDPGDLCSLHKPCAKHGGMSARAIVEDSGRVCCGIVSVNNSIQTECAETALGYIRSGDAVCLKHAKDFQIDRLVEPFPPEYLGLSIERDRLSLQAQRQFQILASATSSTSLRKTQLSEMKLNIGFDKPSAAQTQLTHSDERGTDST